MSEIRLIDANALKEKIDFVFPYDPLADYEENIGEVMKLIDNAPTVEPEEIAKLKRENKALEQEMLYCRENWKKAERPQGDLISRSALEKAILEHCRSEIEAINHFWYDDTIITLIENAPSVETEEIAKLKRENNALEQEMLYCRENWKKAERPQGEWKLIRVADHCGIHDSFVCPFCNYEREYRKKNFCEECGADLRGEKADND